jgi:hypothetical protein
VHKNPLNRVPPSCSAKRRERSCRFAVPLTPLGGFEGTGPFLSVWRDGGAKLSSRRSKKFERAVAFSLFPLVPSSSLLRPRHASPFRRPRSRDYRQRDRSLLACFAHNQTQTVTSLRSSRCAALSTSPLRGGICQGYLMGSRDQI